MNRIIKLFNSKIFLAVISLLASLILWVYVTNVESDQYTKTLRGVEIEFVGEGVLHEKGLSVSDLSTSTVTVEITGPRRTVAGIDSEDVVAQINLSNFNQSTVASMQYTLKYPDGKDASNIKVTRKTPETVTFSVSKLVTKTIPVRGSFDGSTEYGYTSEPISFEPSTITISGADTQLNQISFAWVSFGKDQNVNSTYTEEASFILMNDDKEPISMNNITSSTDIILAKLPILKVKVVPLTVDLVYGAGANELNTTVTIEPSTIKLAGDSDVIDGIAALTLSTIDLSTFGHTNEYTFPIVFDDSLTNIDGIVEAKVTVSVEGLATKTFRIPQSRITCVNVTEGYKVQVSSKAIEVVLRGTEESLEKVKEENIRAVVDLKDFDFTLGSHSVIPKIFVDGSDSKTVGAINQDNVYIEIKKD